MLGATRRFFSHVIRALISIHAPVLGATRIQYLSIGPASEISIHAPVLGATWQSRPSHSIPRYFNPRTRAGCDGAPSRMLISRSIFQSTHPCWVRHNTPYRHQFHIHFNPRTRAGCDAGFRPSRTNVLKFQSTHPCWVRPSDRMPSLMAFCISIHAPVLGATYQSLIVDILKYLFQSTHPCWVRQPSNWLSHNQLFHQPYCELIKSQSIFEPFFQVLPIFIEIKMNAKL